MGWGRRQATRRDRGQRGVLPSGRLRLARRVAHGRHSEGEKQEAGPQAAGRRPRPPSSGEEADGGTLERRLSLKWKCSPEPACPQRRHSRPLFQRSRGPSPAHADAGILAGACDLRPFLLPAPKDGGSVCWAAGRARREEVCGARHRVRLTVGQRLRATLVLGPRAAQAQEGPEASPRAAQEGWGCSQAAASEHGRQRSLVRPHRQLSDGTAPCFLSGQDNSSLSTMP